LPAAPGDGREEYVAEKFLSLGRCSRRSEALAKQAAGAIGEFWSLYASLDFPSARTIWSLSPRGQISRSEQPWVLSGSDADNQRRGTFSGSLLKCFVVANALRIPSARKARECWALLGQPGHLSSHELTHSAGVSSTRGTPLGKSQHFSAQLKSGSH